MTVHFRVKTTDSRPERIEVTRELERRYSEQVASERQSAERLQQVSQMRPDESKPAQR
jgi:uncharacterized protein YpuA (DUF1002 family)